MIFLFIKQATYTNDQFRYHNIENISISPSPLDRRPRILQPDSLIDSKTYERIL